MNLQRVAKAVVLNLPTTADIDIASYGSPAGTECWITGLLPFRRADLISVSRLTAAAEVQQVLTLGAANVVLSNTVYQFKAGNTLNRESENTNQFKPYTATSPAVLVSPTNAAADRYNQQVQLAARVNGDTGANCFAGCKITIPVTSVTMNYATPGLNRPVWIKGATSGSICFIYFTAVGIPNAGTVNGATKVSAVVHVYNGTAPVSGDVMSVIASPIDGSLGTGNAVTLSAAPTTIGQGLVIVDKSGYYNALGTRHGVTGAFVTKGFIPTDLAITVIGAISYGQGPRLAQDVPVKEVTSDNLASGDWNMASASNNPVSNLVNVAKVSDLTSSNAGGYDLITITAKKPVKSSASTGMTQNNVLRQNIFAVNDAAGYAAFYTKLGTI